MLLYIKGPRLCFFKPVTRVQVVLQADFMFTEWFTIAITFELGQ